LTTGHRRRKGKESFFQKRKFRKIFSGLIEESGVGNGGAIIKTDLIEITSGGGGGGGRSSAG